MYMMNINKTSLLEKGWNIFFLRISKKDINIILTINNVDIVGPIMIPKGINENKIIFKLLNVII